LFESLSIRLSGCNREIPGDCDSVVRLDRSNPGGKAPDVQTSELAIREVVGDGSLSHVKTDSRLSDPWGREAKIAKQLGSRDRFS
jgi:hypothetical protein